MSYNLFDTVFAHPTNTRLNADHFISQETREGDAMFMKEELV